MRAYMDKREQRREGGMEWSFWRSKSGIMNKWKWNQTQKLNRPSGEDRFHHRVQEHICKQLLSKVISRNWTEIWQNVLKRDPKQNQTSDSGPIELFWHHEARHRLTFFYVIHFLILSLKEKTQRSLGTDKLTPEVNCCVCGIDVFIKIVRFFVSKKKTHLSANALIGVSTNGCQSPDKTQGRRTSFSFKAVLSETIHLCQMWLFKTTSAE